MFGHVAIDQLVDQARAAVAAPPAPPL